MALNIKDPETDRLARELAELTGQPLTVAVRDALTERLAALQRLKRIGGAPDLSDIIARGRARQTIDDRTAEEILGYDEDGVPT